LDRHPVSTPTFSQILGQDGAIETLSRAYQADRLPHGLIFAGPRGVGKGTTAEALGALFLCEKPKGTSPCGTCGSCTVFAAGNHPDYHRIYKELVRIEHKDRKGIDLSIDVIRPYLIAPASRKSGLGVGKVFVIAEPELMNAHAQNSLLKTLEEPEGRTLIVLITDQEGLLLPTIRSRCQLIRFAPLESKTVLEELRKRGVDAATAKQAVSFADGSLGLALKWIEDGVIATAADLASQLESILGGRPPSALHEWLKKSADAYAEKQLERDKLSSKDQATREGLAIYLTIASQVFRGELARTTDPERLDRLCTAVDAVVRAESYLDQNVNVALTLQQFSLSLAREFVAPGH
jgi:DNA polymerase III subunit delta'